MRKISSYAVGIQQGSLILFSDYQVGGAMWTGEGPREMRRAVAFPEAFREAPSVMVSLSMWDIDHQHNPRMDISAEAVTSERFEIVFRTWGDTRVARVRADWMAIGPCSNDEDWEIE